MKQNSYSTTCLAANIRKYFYIFVGMKIIIFLEKGPDLWEAYATDLSGVWGAGETPKEAINNIHECIKINRDLGKKMPDEYELDVMLQTSMEMLKQILAGDEKIMAELRELL